MMDDDLKGFPIQRVGLVRCCRAFENQLVDSKVVSRFGVGNVLHENDLLGAKNHHIIIIASITTIIITIIITITITIIQKICFSIDGDVFQDHVKGFRKPVV